MSSQQQDYNSHHNMAKVHNDQSILIQTMQIIDQLQPLSTNVPPNQQTGNQQQRTLMMIGQQQQQQVDKHVTGDQRQQRMINDESAQSSMLLVKRVENSLMPSDSANTSLGDDGNFLYVRTC